MSKKLQGIFLILLSSLLLGSYGVWSRLIGDDFGVFFQGYTRAIIILLVLTPLLYLTKKLIPVQRKDWGWLCVFGLFTSFTQAPLFYAFNHMDIGSATLIFFVSMLLTMYLMGIFFFKEKLTVTVGVAFVLACIGLYSIFSFSIAAFAVLAAALAALNGIASGGEVSSSKKLSGDYSPLYITWWSWIFVLLTNAPLSFLLGESQLAPAFDTTWMFQLGYSLASLFGFYFIIAGLKYVDASIGGLLGLLEVIFAIAFGIFLFGETLTGQAIVGSVLIFSAAALPHIVGLLNTRGESVTR